MKKEVAKGHSFEERNGRKVATRLKITCI